MKPNLISNPSFRFKVESRRVLEYEGETAGFEEEPLPVEGRPGGSTVLTMVNNAIPMSMAYNARSLDIRNPKPESPMSRGATVVPHTKIMVGQVGVCITNYEVGIASCNSCPHSPE